MTKTDKKKVYFNFLDHYFAMENGDSKFTMVVVKFVLYFCMVVADLWAVSFYINAITTKKELKKYVSTLTKMIAIGWSVFYSSSKSKEEVWLALFFMVSVFLSVFSVPAFEIVLANLFPKFIF